MLLDNYENLYKYIIEGVTIYADTAKNVEE